MKRLLVVLGLIAGLAGCNYVAPSPQETAVAYKGGTFSATSFEKCVAPATREGYDIGGTYVTYPVGQRTYKFSDEPKSDGPPIEIVDKDGIVMTVKGIAYLSLNTSCTKGKDETLRVFHERIGSKYLPDGETALHNTAEWSEMLRDYVGTQLDASMDAAAKGYGWRQLHGDAKVRQDWATAVGTDTPSRVERNAGGKFFCAPNFSPGQPCGQFALTIGTPRPPDRLLSALADRQAAEEVKAAVITEESTIKKLVGLLGADGYIAYRALKMADEGKQPPVVFVPQGGRVNVDARAR